MCQKLFCEYEKCGHLEYFGSARCLPVQKRQRCRGMERDKIAAEDEDRCQKCTQKRIESYKSRAYDSALYLATLKRGKTDETSRELERSGRKEQEYFGLCGIENDRKRHLSSRSFERTPRGRRSRSSSRSRSTSSERTMQARSVSRSGINRRSEKALQPWSDSTTRRSKAGRGSSGSDVSSERTLYDSDDMDLGMVRYGYLSRAWRT